ncbi:hypothetical protein QCA50_008590 [Cerrena zonata]|uniref:Uncharacterized protein n=1 Tax=Cerrena zonata TaxID=2478898 RepID=A0AAW0GAQ2_9APHY
MPSPYAPDEPSELIWFEQLVNASGNVGAMAYGVHMAIFVTTLYHILYNNRKIWWQFMLIVSLFALGTINISCNLNFNQKAWIDNRNYPEGPIGYLQNEQAIPVDTIGNAAGCITTFLADGFLLYRCFLVWNDRPWVLILPSLAYIASTVMSVLTVVAAARPGSTLWAKTTLKVSVPYWGLTMALNITLSLLLILRLLSMQRTLRQVLGEDYARVYAKIVSMSVESALPYALVSFIFIVLYGIQNNAYVLFIPLLVQVQCIAPELIILQVARGKAWSETSRQRTRQVEISTVLDVVGSSGFGTEAYSTKPEYAYAV